MPSQMNHMPFENYYDQHHHCSTNQCLVAALPENSNFGAKFKFYCKSANFALHENIITRIDNNLNTTATHYNGVDLTEHQVLEFVTVALRSPL